jgi:hypothetical protein
MIDTKWTTDFFSVVEGRGTVAICQDVYVRSWEDLEGCFERRSDDVRRLVAWYQKRSVLNVLCDGFLSGEVGRRRVLLKQNE